VHTARDSWHGHSRFATPEQVLDDVERMLDPRANLCPGPLDGNRQILERTLAHYLDLAVLECPVALHRRALQLPALAHAREPVSTMSSAAVTAEPN
jgi:hypothetical protein